MRRMITNRAPFHGCNRKHILLNIMLAVVFMEVYDHKNNCYGCNACGNVCHAKAIDIHTDKEGFQYPFINQALCTQCDRCKEVCLIYQDKNVNSNVEHNAEYNVEQKVYAVKLREETIRLLSSSGGMFTAISDFVLEKGGIVYGAAFDENLNVCHKRAVTKEERDEMRGSKYVQSNIGAIFQAVKKDLLEEKQVLFTGTPCQVAGLKRYLRNTDSSLLSLCDIICHGVPSNLMWQEYIRFVEGTKRVHLEIHYFRTKINGWHSMTSKNVYRNGKEDYQSILSQIHMRLFLSDFMLRPCCYNCKFARMERYSDITIGDYWGVEKTLPEYDDNKGISLVLTNTKKGSELFAAVREKLEVRESNTANCKQRNLEHPTLLPLQRDEFWKAFKEQGYEYVAKKYAGYTLNSRVFNTLYNQWKRVKKLKKL